MIRAAPPPDAASWTGLDALISERARWSGPADTALADLPDEGYAFPGP
jgi:hypothetical protein